VGGIEGGERHQVVDDDRGGDSEAEGCEVAVRRQEDIATPVGIARAHAVPQWGRRTKRDRRAALSIPGDACPGAGVEDEVDVLVESAQVRYELPRDPAAASSVLGGGAGVETDG
jgi:hypothetical protein